MVTLTVGCSGSSTSTSADTSAATSTGAATSTRVIDLDYDTGDTSEFNIVQLTDFPGHSLTFDKALTRHGSGFSGRFEVQPGDNPLDPALGTERAEVGYGSFGEGDDVWLGWSSYFPKPGLNPTDTAATNVTNTFTQFHESAPNVSVPCFTMSIDTNNFAFPYHWKARISGGQVSGDNLPITPVSSYDLGRVIYNQWVDFVVHIRLSDDPAIGRFEIWVNGVRPAAVPSIVTRATKYPGRTVYFKQGYYRTPPPAAATSVIYHDMTKIVIGGSFAEVDPS